MRYYLLTGVLYLLSLGSFSQTLTWINTLTPKEKDAYIYFPGSENSTSNEYVISESGDKARRNIIIQGADLKVQEIINEKGKGNGENWIGTFFYLNDKSYVFFVDDNEKGPIFTIYCRVQNLDGTVIKNRITIGKVAAGKSKWSYSFRHLLCIKPSYDGKSFLAALVYEKVDQQYSMVNISEWNEDIKPTFSNNYKIAFHPYYRYVSNLMGSIRSSDSFDPEIQDIRRDANGFLYMIARSESSDEEDHIPTWLYQYKSVDPSYSKIFKKEWAKTWSAIQTELLQDNMGRTYLVNMSYEFDKKRDRDERNYVNAAFIGTFKQDGQLQDILSQKLSYEMITKFVKASDLDRNGGAYSLRIKNIFSTTDGGYYIVWLHEHTSSGMGAYSATEDRVTNNLLIQYYNKDNKLLWEKPVFKKQENRKSSSRYISDDYTGMNTFLINDKLYILYPDDPANASKSPDDGDVNMFIVQSSFGGNDRAGFMFATFSKAGTYTRKYINWTEDKKGYGLLVNSLKYVGNNEFIGVARALHQKMTKVVEGDYAIFKLKF